MTTKGNPYREARLEHCRKQMEDWHKPEYGLICKPIIKLPKVKPHVCNLPGLWQRLMCWIGGNPISRGSMFRCPDCKTFWLMNEFGDWEDWSQSSPGASKAFWVQLGGRLQKDDYR